MNYSPWEKLKLEKILDNFDNILNKIYRYKLSKLLVKPKLIDLD
jgi:hypothetical protein